MNFNLLRLNFRPIVPYMVRCSKNNCALRYNISTKGTRRAVGFIAVIKTRLCKKEWTVLRCRIENAAMQLLKARRRDYVDRQTLQKTSCTVRHLGETDP